MYCQVQVWVVGRTGRDRVDVRQFTWTRDSALTMLTISSRFLPQHYLKSWSVPTHTDGDAEMDPDPLIEPLVRAYVSFQQRLQTVKSRSGDLWTGGLNEPKFDVNGTAFEGDWGRPQRYVS